MHWTLPSSLAPTFLWTAYGTIHAASQSLTVIRTISSHFTEDIHSMPSKILYLCVLVRPFALFSTVGLFFLSVRFSIFLWSGDNIRYHMGTLCVCERYVYQMGNYCKNETFPMMKCIIVIKSNALLPTNYDRSRWRCWWCWWCHSFFLAYVNYGWSWLFFC